MRDTDYRGLFDSGVTHQYVFDVHGTDPLTARLNQVFGAVDNLHKTFVIHGGHVPRLEPAIFGPAVRLVGSIVVAGSHPGSADFQFAGSIAVAGSFDGIAFETFRAHDAEFDEGRRPALFCSDFILLVGGPVAHVAFEFADGGEWRGFGHAPEVEYVKVVFVQGAHEAFRWGGAPANEADGPAEFPATGIFLESSEHAEPNGGNTARDGNEFLADQVENAFGVDIGPRENQTCAGHGAGIGQAPGVGVKHGGHGEDGIVVADGEGIHAQFGKGMQDQGAMGVDHAFGAARGAGGVTHGGAVIFVDGGVAKIVTSLGQNFFVV